MYLRYYVTIENIYLLLFITNTINYTIIILLFIYRISKSIQDAPLEPFELRILGGPFSQEAPRLVHQPQLRELLAQISAQALDVKALEGCLQGIQDARASRWMYSATSSRATEDSTAPGTATALDRRGPCLWPQHGHPLQLVGQGQRALCVLQQHLGDAFRGSQVLQGAKDSSAAWVKTLFRQPTSGGRSVPLRGKRRSVRSTGRQRSSSSSPLISPCKAFSKR